jgi:hypothetical protein
LPSTVTANPGRHRTSQRGIAPKQAQPSDMVKFNRQVPLPPVASCACDAVHPQISRRSRLVFRVAVEGEPRRVGLDHPSVYLPNRLEGLSDLPGRQAAGFPSRNAPRATGPWAGPRVVLRASDAGPKPIRRAATPSSPSNTTQPLGWLTPALCR